MRYFVKLKLTLEFEFVLVSCTRPTPSTDDLFGVGSGVRAIVRHYKKIQQNVIQNLSNHATDILKLISYHVQFVCLCFFLSF